MAISIAENDQKRPMVLGEISMSSAEKSDKVNGMRKQLKFSSAEKDEQSRVLQNNGGFNCRKGRTSQRYSTQMVVCGAEKDGTVTFIRT